MGKLSAKYLIRKNKRNPYFLVRKKGDSDKQFLNRIMHLPLQNQFIEQIHPNVGSPRLRSALAYQWKIRSNEAMGKQCNVQDYTPFEYTSTFSTVLTIFLLDIQKLPLIDITLKLKISDCGNVKVLYLQNNLLKKIENMENFPLLTHLYLQRNFIVKIENLQALVHLKKIYLGHNEIQVLEGMEDLKEIKEIHLECQKFRKGEILYFEPLTVRSLGETLHVLNISDNSLTSLACLKNLMNLRILLANDNLLRDIDDIAETICEWRCLQELGLIGNAVTQNRWYRDTLIFASKSLKVLDNVPIHENTRIFIEKLTEKKKIYYEKHKRDVEESGNKEKRKTLKFADDNESQDSCLAFANNFPPNRPAYLYPPWKLRSNVNPNHQKSFLPRPYWKKGSAHS